MWFCRNEVEQKNKQPTQEESKNKKEHSRKPIQQHI